MGLRLTRRDPALREIERLQRENARLKRRAEIAEELVQIQKKFCQLVEAAQQSEND